MHRDELDELLNEWLKPSEFQDSATNGLQIEGRQRVEHVVCGVSANLALIERAVAQGADTLFVHHGIFWEPGVLRVCGWRGERIRRLIRADVNLFAYHLPLDAHPVFGNNAGLADVLDLSSKRSPFGTYKGQQIGVSASFQSGLPLSEVVSRIREGVGEPICVFGELTRPIRTVGICSGGATDMLTEAIDKGLDLFITGEVNEWTKAMSDETGVAFVAAGHHATERFGPRRVAEELTNQPGLKADFIDVPNPA